MKNFRLLTAALCAAVLLCGFSTTAYAGGGDEGEYTGGYEEPAATPEPTIEPGEGFSGEGNLVTRDLLYDEHTNKQFITVQMKKVESEKVKLYLAQATAAVEQAVACTAQTYVEALKIADAFDKEAQERAFDMAKGTAALLLSREAKDMLSQLYGDTDTWLDTKIEQTVRNTKAA